MKTVAAPSGGRGRALALILVVLILVTGFVSARAAAVTIQEDRVALEPGEILIVHAQTSWGLPLRDALSWSILPSHLGTMDERGGFHAGELSGSGTLTARFGAASAEIPVTVTCPKTALIQGVRFEVSCGRVADVYVDVSASGGAERAREEVEREADRVSRDLQITTDRRFRVYYVGSTAALATLSDLGAWNDRTGLDHLYQYYAAAQAAQFLIDDITLPGLLRVLKIMSTGVTFPRALAQAVPDFDYNAF